MTSFVETTLWVHFPLPRPLLTEGEEEKEAPVKDGREGRLGEMGRKRKINEKTDEPADDAEDAEASDSSGPEF